MLIDPILESVFLRYGWSQRDSIFVPVNNLFRLRASNNIRINKFSLDNVIQVRHILFNLLWNRHILLLIFILRWVTYILSLWRFGVLIIRKQEIFVILCLFHQHLISPFDCILDSMVQWARIFIHSSILSLSLNCNLINFARLWCDAHVN